MTPLEVIADDVTGACDVGAELARFAPSMV